MSAPYVLTPRELAEIRGVFGPLIMPDGVSIYRTTSSTADGMLGYTPTFTLLDTVECSYMALNGREAAIAAALAVEADLVVLMPALTDVTEKDQLVLTDTETSEIKHLEISHVADMTRELVTKVYATEYR